MKKKKIITILVVGIIAIPLAVLVTRTALAVLGDLLAKVDLPGNSSCNVGLAFDGTYIMTIDDGWCAGSKIGIRVPPAGNGNATWVATKTVKNTAGSLVAVSVIDWDASRGLLWAAYADKVYTIPIGDPTVTEDVVATFQFAAGVGGISLVDGLAWDANDDTLYYSPDMNTNVYQFSLGTGANPPLGTLMNTVTPKNAAGAADGSVSGVAIGANLVDGTGTLYIGRDGAAQIRRVNKTTGAWISDFATTSGRVEDLVCDPVTYAPLEAILAKDAYNSLYEAFEVEVGTCPLPVEEEITCTQGFWKTHPDKWTNLVPSDVPAWGGGKTYLQILGLEPKKGDASVILAHAYITALLNTGTPADDLTAAAALLTDYPIGSGDLEAKGKNAHPDRAAALAVAETLQMFNESMECPLE